MAVTGKATARRHERLEVAVAGSRRRRIEIGGIRTVGVRPITEKFTWRR